MHFSSPLASRGPDELYSALCRNKVYIASSIKTTLEVQQDREPIIVPVGNSELHIAPNSIGGLDIFVPIDADARDFCIASKLPHRFSACLMECKPSMVDPRVVSVIKSIMRARPSSAKRILEESGIIDLGLAAPKDDGVTVNDEPELVPFPVGLGQTPLNRPKTPPSTPGFFSSSHQSPFRGTSNFVRSPLRGQQGPNEQYSRLLAKVIEEGRRIGLPSYDDMFDTKSRAQNGNPLASYAFSSPFWREMVGAAGELFVSYPWIHSQLQPY